jgi:N-acetylglucosamine-6-phosphate deacetylase
MERQPAQAGVRLALINGRIVLPGEVISGRALVIEEGRILGLADPGQLGSGTAVFDAQGRYITPGLIDLHVHGALGHTFNEPTPESFAAITGANLRHGVTSLLATLVAAPIPDLIAGLELCEGWLAAPGLDPATGRLHAEPPDAFVSGGSTLLGAHIEGPYLSPAQKGALDPRYLWTPDDGSADALLEYARAIRIMVLAPELPGALPLIGRLVALGIVPAAGHSSARDEDVRAAMAAGLRHVTHIWSAMSATVREGPWRKPGLLEAALAFDGLSVEMIADNRHLPPTLMQLAYKCIGPDRLCAISDASSGAGLPEGARFTMGNMQYEVSGGVGMMLDRSAFAGSTTFVNQMIPVLVGVVGIPVPEAVRMLTLTPARVLGLEGRKGSLAAGADADIALFDEDFAAWRAMIGGRWAYVRN